MTSPALSFSWSTISFRSALVMISSAIECSIEMSFSLNIVGAVILLLVSDLELLRCARLFRYFVALSSDGYCPTLSP
jgi:hypothetical protein